MNYYSFSFHYPGPYVNFPGPDEETRSAWDHDTNIESLLKSTGLDFRHEYSWTDGSCYKFVMSELDINAVRSVVTAAMVGTPYRVDRVREMDRSYRISPGSDEDQRTIEDLFNKAAPA
jgi:hypothetical protein